MERVVGYYRAYFKGDRGVAQGDPLSPALSHHFQCGVGCSGTELGGVDGVGSGRVGRLGIRGWTSECPLLRGRWHDFIVGPMMDTGCIYYPGCPVR